MKLATVGVNFPPTFNLLIAHGFRIVLLALTSSCSSAHNGTPNATAIMSTSPASASEASNVFYNTGTFVCQLLTILIGVLISYTFPYKNILLLRYETVARGDLIAGVHCSACGAQQSRNLVAISSHFADMQHFQCE